MVRFSVFLLLFLLIGIFVTFFYLANLSKNKSPNYGLKQDQLKSCPSKPNCVSSFQEDKDSENYIAPLPFDQASLDQVQELLKKESYEIKKTKENYIYATQKSSFFGFIDDIELLLKDGKIFFRSQSRVGYSDLGKNRSRISDLKFKITQNL